MVEFISSSSSFIGLWKRIKLFEPKNILGPIEEQEKTVLWFQGINNIFIDLRIFPEHSIYNYQNIKSFSGDIEYNSNKSILTWNRRIDYRPLGLPDLGLINFLSENEIEEDGVLEGDDYKEIWIRIITNNEFNVSIILTISNSNGTIYRKGYFLIVGEYFALTLSRPILPENEQNILDIQLKSYFSEGTPLSDTLENYLNQYITIAGQISDWKIQYSLQKELVGDSIESPNHCQNSELKSTLQSLSWEFVGGKIPIIYSNWTGNSIIE